MRIKYKIIWVDDEPDDMEIKKDLLYKIVEKNCMFPTGMESPYKSYNEFKEKMLNKFTTEKFVDCDIMLIDYNLSENGDEQQNGEELIKMLREKGIYTDVLFYSSNMKGYRANRHTELDNVVYSDTSTNEFQLKFEKILKKQINSAMGIQNIRGYLMDATSDFDFVVRNFVEEEYDKLSEPQKKIVLKKIEIFIENQKYKENKKFNNIAESYNKTKLIKPAMASLDSVMTVRDKFFIYFLMKGFLNDPNKGEEYEADAQKLADEYEKQIISKRNKLAHNKLKYGDFDLNHIKIATKKTDLKCDCETCNRAKIYTLEDCNMIRQDIFNNYKVLVGEDK